VNVRAAARADVVVAGHICLDIVPSFPAGSEPGPAAPGGLVVVDPAVVSTGGVVSNTGIALRRLGLRVRLVGKVGRDAFGRVVLELLRRDAGAAAGAMRVDAASTTSYSIVLSPPGVDRTFLHCPGANDTFGADDVTDALLDGARAFHFGYPPLMRRFYADEGRELEALFLRARDRGLTTSLDMALANPGSDAAKAPWEAILRRVLPHVDAFLPSWDDMSFALGVSARGPDGAELADVAETLLAWGTRIVVLKLGDQGAYVRTADRELLAPCFRVDVVGTTGAGDATVAGFLAGWLRGLPLEESMTLAVAVGACCVEASDSLSGVRDWASIHARVRAGWPRREPSLELPGWTWNDDTQLFVGPHGRK
jgi:sugar/nucleoside kinase (ribokinase family)